MEDFRSIKVTVREDRKPGQTRLVISNPTSLKLIGQGAQGAVFELSSNRCVKIYAKPNSAERERKALEAGGPHFFMPQLYETGKNYIIMELIQGPDLGQYLDELGEVPKRVVKQVMQIFDSMKKIGFSRIDMRLRHILVTKEEKLKVVDHVNAFSAKSEVPAKLLKDLKKKKLLKPFLKKVKKIDPKTYELWKG
ncbi:AarF/UbiB family protein [Ammoniphilus sp. 3BR4]|uniref:AarF/UbiB family protein n=1 Tax=Ammoniphilus sp. 3BR4 TaxID=3158265 RepID=UPI003467E15C